MNMSASHSSHMNITDSRKAAIRFFNNTGKGLVFTINHERHTKMRVINGIKAGMFDGYFYGMDVTVNIAGETIRVINLTPRDCGYTRKIGH